MNRRMSGLLRGMICLAMAAALVLMAVLGIGYLRDRKTLKEKQQALESSRAAWERIAEDKVELQGRLKEATNQLKEAKLTLEESTARAAELRTEIDTLKAEIEALKTEIEGKKSGD